MKFNSTTPRTTLAFANPSCSFLRGYAFIIKNILRVWYSQLTEVLQHLILVILTWLLEERSRNWLLIIKGYRESNTWNSRISAWRVDIEKLQKRSINMVRIQILPLISCVILGKMLNYFLSQFPHLQVKNGNNGTLSGVYWEFYI